MLCSETARYLFDERKRVTRRLGRAAHGFHLILINQSMGRPVFLSLSLSAGERNVAPKSTYVHESFVCLSRLVVRVLSVFLSVGCVE